MNKQNLEKRREELKQQFELAKAQLHQIQGAMLLVDEMLQNMEEQEVVTKEPRKSK